MKKRREEKEDGDRIIFEWEVGKSGDPMSREGTRIGHGSRNSKYL